ncbi:hypothetical protein A2714_03200 [Candidatus Woesebacteria bacterium RIFCSPHIGHO2_01_FULL_38_9]|uniref:Antitoxin n=2 Tax=Candidatus Woeseibacteriota TaxID=1752722 RepID=A0A1F7Y3F4_9BACT|nr:MAG: hypothetical protein A2714_03200 [Candidatus Woesebacteria bacterium RIFCSPHIGHO2_01_FULL_38_9]OGM61044.1 MAG: hypothetical protein A3A75_02675 [Candidatus Woesebacteria bacterium RIFCSPLOWO2_01_FULL_39_10]
MTITVSVSDFRNNLAGYLTQIARGTKILIKDDKKNLELAEVSLKRQFDKDSYESSLRKAAGTFLFENHTEFSSYKKVESWLRSTRRLSDRKVKSETQS